MDNETLRKHLEALKLNYLAANMDKFIAEAAKTKMPPQALIERIVRLEFEESKRRSIESRMKQSKVNSKKLPV